MAIDRNPLIGYLNRTPSASFSATTAAADYPAANLGTLPLPYVWRSSTYTPGSVAAQAITWTYGGEELSARLFSWVRHNASISDSTFRLQLYSDAGFTTEVADSDALDLVGGAEIWPPVYTDDELEWEDDNWWTAKYTSDQIAGKTWTRVIDLGAEYLHKSGKLTITDANNAAGYVQAGYLAIERAHQFTRGITLGSARGVQVVQSESEAAGVVYVGDGVVKRVFRGSFQYLPRSEAKNILGEMKGRNTRKDPFTWHPFPQEPKTWLVDSMFARFSEVDLGQYALAIHDSEPVSIVEV
jgi:hypothetical protein